MSKETSKMKNRFPYVESFYEACIHTLHQKKTIDKDLGDLLACMKILILLIWIIYIKGFSRITQSPEV